MKAEQLHATTLDAITSLAEEAAKRHKHESIGVIDVAVGLMIPPNRGPQMGRVEKVMLVEFGVSRRRFMEVAAEEAGNIADRGGEAPLSSLGAANVLYRIAARRAIRRAMKRPGVVFSTDIFRELVVENDPMLSSVLQRLRVNPNTLKEKMSRK